MREDEREQGIRSTEQEVAAGQNEATPFTLLTTVIGVVAALFAIALVLVVVAYVLA